MQSDLDKLRGTLQKTIDQGRKTEYLTSTDEWKFYAGWLEATYQEHVNAIMNGDFMNDPQREAFNKGIARAIRIFVDTPDQFTRAKEKATAELARREKAEAEAEDG